MSHGKRVFRYDCEQGRVVEVTGERPAAASVPALGAYSEAKPLVSDSIGCLPHQVPEMREMVKRRGLVGVNVRNNGQVEFTSRGKGGRVGLMKVRGVHDHDGGYGDG